jgi:hypothetical protein
LLDATQSDAGRSHASIDTSTVMSIVFGLSASPAPHRVGGIRYAAHIWAALPLFPLSILGSR